MKNYFVINTSVLTNVNIKYMRFCFCQWIWDTDFMFQNKNDFENIKKLESILIWGSSKTVWHFFITKKSQKEKRKNEHKSDLHL